MSFDSFPLELRQDKRHDVWKAIPDTNGKVKKVPWRPDGSGELKWSDPKNLIGWQDAVDAYITGCDHGINFCGIGYILESDSDNVVIDLDGAINEDGSIRETAQTILRCFGSYAEISPSGKGIHIWINAKISGRNIPQTIYEGQAVEIFTHDHHVTVTGNFIPGYETLINCAVLIN